MPEIPCIEDVHPLHTMGDSFAVPEIVVSRRIQRAVIVGAGYAGVEMADAVAHKGIGVELVGRSKSVLPIMDPKIWTTQ